MIDLKAAFPDGVVPPLPVLPISALTAKLVTQEAVDQVLQCLPVDRPDIIFSLIESDINQHADLEKTAIDLKTYIAQLGEEDVNSIKAGQYLWELRVRLRKLLNLPATPEEVRAALDKSEQVVPPEAAPAPELESRDERMKRIVREGLEKYAEVLKGLSNR